MRPHISTDKQKQPERPEARPVQEIQKLSSRACHGLRTAADSSRQQRPAEARCAHSSPLGTQRFRFAQSPAAPGADPSFWGKEGNGGSLAAPGLPRRAGCPGRRITCRAQKQSKRCSWALTIPTSQSTLFVSFSLKRKARKAKTESQKFSLPLRCVSSTFPRARPQPPLLKNN